MLDNTKEASGRNRPKLRVNTLSPRRVAAVLVLFFSSGMTSLIYQVLWVKELGLLFGSTVYATATTLAAFFLGLAVGGYFCGQRAPHAKSPLRTYGLLELAVAVSVTGYFLILAGYRLAYPSLFEWFGETRGAFIAVKFMLALLVLFPPAFFMGGTLPIISQYLVREMSLLGRKVSILYAMNTLGAAVGALLAGFYLPILIGFRDTYLLAMGLTASLGLVALCIVRDPVPAPTTPPAPAPVNPSLAPDAVGLGMLRGLAFLSGTVTLSLQVLWTRMFAQVLQNSVYTFSTVVVVFLLGLALGAGAAHGLMRTRLSPVVSLFALLTGAALLVSASPFVFDTWTDGLRYVGAGSDWNGYVLHVVGMAALVMGPALVLLGGVFPLLLRLAQPYDTSAGRLVGQLAALNTAGAIFGSVAAGFVILDRMGMWAGIRLMAVLYLLVALHLVYGWGQKSRRAVATIPLAAILLLVSLLDTSRLPAVRVDPIKHEESLLEVWEGSAATVAVVRRGDSLKIKVDNHYALGGTGARDLEALQGYLPILLHSNARTVYALGLGTGITAGAGLKFPIKRLVVSELVPEVVEASRKYFARFNHGLFPDKRSQVIVEDGRNYLAGTKEKFDVIIADLFVPWKAGTGNLYTLEHFQSVRDRLQEDGLLMQWLPTYQLSQVEFAIIVRTLLEVFPQVTLWRGDFFARKPIVGLLAQSREASLPADALLFKIEDAQQTGERIPLLAHYVGNLGTLPEFFANYPVNHDDQPIIEYQAPITHRLQRANKVNWLAGAELMDLMARIQKHTPPEIDTYLKDLSADRRQLPYAGLYLHRAQMLKHHGDLKAANDAFHHYRNIVDAYSRS